jgi:hypothetical protein
MFKPEWTAWKQRHLTSRLASDFSGWDKDNAKFEAQLEKVIKALHADAQARQGPPKSKL